MSRASRSWCRSTPRRKCGRAGSDREIVPSRRPEGSAVRSRGSRRGCSLGEFAGRSGIDGVCSRLGSSAHLRRDCRSDGRSHSFPSSTSKPWSRSRDDRSIDGDSKWRCWACSPAPLCCWRLWELTECWRSAWRGAGKKSGFAWLLAQPGNILSMVRRRGLAPVGIGFLAGVAGAAALGKVLSGLFFRVSPYDWRIILAVLVLTTTSALAACWIPASRATRVDPLEALRYE
jgi:hypothetical protein